MIWIRRAPASRAHRQSDRGITMKRAITILVCGLAAGLASAQNPQIIQNTKTLMDGVSKNATAASNEALGIKTPAHPVKSAPVAVKPSPVAAQTKSAPAAGAPKPVAVAAKSTPKVKLAVASGIQK